MTKGELISACIKLMFDNGSNQIDTTDISNSGEYDDRTNNIIESINRGLNRVFAVNRLPFEICKVVWDSNSTYSYNLNELAMRVLPFNDDIQNNNNKRFKKIARVIWGRETDGFTKEVHKYDYNVLNGVLHLPPLNENECYLIEMECKPIKLSYEFEDSYELPYDDEILGIIPYYVKGELYEEDNPNVALFARNTFETYLSDLPTNNSNNVVEDVFENWW